MKSKFINIFVTVLLLVSIITSITYLPFFNYIKAFIWSITTVIMLACGLYFTYKLHFSQINIIALVKSLKPSKTNDGGIKPMESLFMNLAAKIGVGSLAGIALAIYIGGPGSIFWMWISSLICAINTFAETILGVSYQKKDGDNYVGGPPYYIKKGLNNKFLATLYAIIIIIAYIGGFLLIQSNTIVSVTNTITNINPWIITLIIGFLSSLVILKGTKSIANFTSKIVPIMGILYLFLGLIIMLKNINLIPQIFSLIIEDAFNIKSITSGFLGTIIIGIERGIFATEAGLGTSAITSGCTKGNPIKQAYLQVWGIHFTTLIICTITAFIILSSHYLDTTFTTINGIELTSFAFHEHLGKGGIIALALITILFAFSTIISGYYYGESNIKFICPHITKNGLTIFKIITLILIITGGIIHAGIIWNIVDLFVAFLSIINLYAIYQLRQVIFMVVHKHK